MNKLKIVLITILAILLSAYKCHSLTVHAQALPVISNPTFELVQNGQNNLVTGPFFSYGIAPFYNGLDVLDSFLGDVSLTAEDFVVRPLSEIEKENLASDFQTHFYDSEGNEISIDDLYYCYANNGYNKCELYMDINGNALYEDPNHSNVLLNLGFVNTLSNDSWDSIYSNLASRINNGNLNFYPDIENIPNNPNTYFVWIGNTVSGEAYNAGWLLIMNQWIPGKIQPINSTNDIHSWYTNDLTLFQSGSTLRTLSTMSVTSGTYNVSGYTYRYLVEGPRYVDSMGAPVNYNDWVNNRVYGRVFACQGIHYNSLSSPENSIGFKKVVIPEVPLIDFDELYSYDELQNLQPQGNQVPIVNPDFNPNHSLSDENYPFQYPAPANIAVPSTLPLPGSNPGLDPLPDFAPDPLLDLSGSDLPFNIPFLKDLQNRFPFCIPWDFSRFVNALRAESIPPAWDFDYSITTFGHTYTVHVEGDLSDFNSLALIFRELVFITFLVWLLFISYKYFF